MARHATLLALAFLSRSAALVSQDGHTGRLPAMGWSSWNEYACEINETVFLEVGSLLKDLGLADLGYSYVNIDDCWSDKEYQRDNVTGKIRPHYGKFPGGIKHTADKIHELGLKLGIYGDAGTATCAGYAGSLEHEAIDAETFAEWGIDYLKYDNCNVPTSWHDAYQWFPESWNGGPPNEDQTTGGGEARPIPAPEGYDWKTSNTFTRYKRMSDALLATNRSILYSQCSWGHARFSSWGNITGHSWRMWGDIVPQWHGQAPYIGAIMPLLNHASFWTQDTNFWGHSDYDSLEVGNGDLTLEENRSHFAMWAALKSPLIIGTLLRNIKPEILDILMNKDLVAFNQDGVYGRPAKPYKWGVNEDNTWNQTHPAEFWSGVSTRGVHVFAVNTLEEAVVKTVFFNEVPELEDEVEYRVYDMWTGKSVGVFTQAFSQIVARHDTLAIRLVKADEDEDEHAEL